MLIDCNQFTDENIAAQSEANIPQNTRLKRLWAVIAKQRTERSLACMAKRNEEEIVLTKDIAKFPVDELNKFVLRFFNEVRDFKKEEFRSKNSKRTHFTTTASD